MKINLTIGIPVWLDRICVWPVMVYRRRKYGSQFRKIYLGEGKFTIVEPPDYYRLQHFKWWLHANGSNLYAARTSVNDNLRSKIIFMHRQIMNPPEGFVVDHKNCDSLDNRRGNLRLATYSQNMCNRRKRKSATSRFNGVSFNRKYKKWSSQISYKGKQTWLGRFDSEIEAAKAYDEAAKKYHKEFARLNFSNQP